MFKKKDTSSPAQAQVNLDALDSEVAMAASIEKRKNTLAGKISVIMAFCMAVFHIYTGFFGLLDFVLQRGIHMAFALTILILNMPLVEKIAKGKFASNKIFSFVCYTLDIMLIVLMWAAVFVSKYEYVMRIPRA